LGCSSVKFIAVPYGVKLLNSKMLFIGNQEVIRPFEEWIDKEEKALEIVTTQSVEDALNLLIHHSLQIILIDSQHREEASKRFLTSIREIPVIILASREESALPTSEDQKKHFYIFKDKYGHYLNILSITIDNIIEIRNKEKEKDGFRRALIDVERRHEILLRNTNDGFWDWTLKTGEVSFSKRWQEILGFDSEELGNNLTHWMEKIHPDDRQKFKIDMEEHRLGHSDS